MVRHHAPACSSALLQDGRQLRESTEPARCLLVQVEDPRAAPPEQSRWREPRQTASKSAPNVIHLFSFSKVLRAAHIPRFGCMITAPT